MKTSVRQFVTSCAATAALANAVVTSTAVSTPFAVDRRVSFEAWRVFALTELLDERCGIRLDDSALLNGQPGERELTDVAEFPGVVVLGLGHLRRRAPVVEPRQVGLALALFAHGNGMGARGRLLFVRARKAS